VRFTAVTLLANLIYWCVLFAVMLAALNVAGLEAARDLLNRVLLSIPNVVVAVLILLFGSLLGKFARAASWTPSGRLRRARSPNDGPRSPKLLHLACLLLRSLVKH